MGQVVFLTCATLSASPTMTRGAVNHHLRCTDEVESSSCRRPRHPQETGHRLCEGVDIHCLQ